MATATSNSRPDQAAATELAADKTDSNTPDLQKSPQGRPQHTVRMTLTINTTTYEVEPVPCDPGTALQCFALRKSNQVVYHVSRHDHGAECTCADFEFNRNHRDPLGCKHIRAMVAIGVLDTRAARVQPVRSPSGELGFDDEFESAPAKKWSDWTDTTRYGIRRRP
ncbi:hypothetical protein Sinac_1669 [Singulisphaera acidiphila DSM 18658]|uniref:SWIM-type domain-containing protein n=1 Tax=Singulisphaera acidiphila (strain ATCC BAA-1392 / DSM 18658 / VKM B-2454 / MOB10) TaxID=886293 RepID=L0D9X4_SINAD|nr:hypothetical protein Sinac_1669 [Singulisphaera acidiphila DSM 18658]